MFLSSLPLLFVFAEEFYFDFEAEHSSVNICGAQQQTLAVSQSLWRTRPLWSLKVSPSEALLTSPAVSLAFGAFPGCFTRCFTLTSRFLPPRPTRVTIYTTRLFFHFSKICYQQSVRLRQNRFNQARCVWTFIQTGMTSALTFWHQLVSFKHGNISQKQI